MPTETPSLDQLDDIAPGTQRPGVIGRVVPCAGGWLVFARVFGMPFRYAPAAFRDEPPPEGAPVVVTFVSCPESPLGITWLIDTPASAPHPRRPLPSPESTKGIPSLCEEAVL